MALHHAIYCQIASGTWPQCFVLAFCKLFCELNGWYVVFRIVLRQKGHWKLKRECKDFLTMSNKFMLSIWIQHLSKIEVGIRKRRRENLKKEFYPASYQFSQHYFHIFLSDKYCWGNWDQDLWGVRRVHAVFLLLSRLQIHLVLRALLWRTSFLVMTRWCLIILPFELWFIYLFIYLCVCVCVFLGGGGVGGKGGLQAFFSIAFCWP